MTKQDVYDIIQLLDNLFQENGLEVRDVLTFKFENSDSDFYLYDDDVLFYQSFFDEDGYFDREEKVDSIKDNLVICYQQPYHWYENNIQKQLEEDIKLSEFNLKVFKYLSQEFKVISQDEEDDERFFIIQDPEKQNENIQLKKFNQF